MFVLTSIVMSSAVFAGEVGGIKNYTDTVEGNESVSYNLILKANELLTIKLSANADSNIDCYLHDWKTGNTLASDTSPSSSCFLSYTPKNQGKYILNIVNTGDKSNTYQFVTDNK